MSDNTTKKCFNDFIPSSVIPKSSWKKSGDIFENKATFFNYKKEKKSLVLEDRKKKKRKQEGIVITKEGMEGEVVVEE